jgi:hypothetical protein
MGTFAETAFVDNRLSFANQEEHKSVLRFRLLKTNGSRRSPLAPFSVCRFRFPFAENKRKLPFSLVPFSVCRIPETWRHGDMDSRRHGDTETWRHGDMYLETSNGKRKPRRYHRKQEPMRFPLIRLPFAYRAKKWKFVVCPFVDEETNGNYLFANGYNCIGSFIERHIRPWGGGYFCRFDLTLICNINCYNI